MVTSPDTLFSELHRRFDQNVPRQVLLGLGVIVAHNHLHSKETAGEQYGEVGEARCGVLRWVKTDADVLRNFRNGTTGVKAELVTTPVNGGMHLEIICGEFKILLIHDIDPDAVVPLSDYGKAAARHNEAPLFITQEEWESQLPEVEPSPYTAILFHSKKTTSSLPESLEIRFPNGNGDYQAPAINLYSRFVELRDEDLVNQLRAEMLARLTAAPEVVEDQAHPIVRKARQIKA